LYFLPAVIILLFLYSGKQKIKDSFLFGGILLGLYALETACYALFAGIPGGQLEVILKNHVADMEIISSFLDVFRRYSLANLELYWQIPFLVFAVLSGYTILKNREKKLMLLQVLTISFFFFITFTLSGLHPLKMAEPFVNRYFSAILPFVFITIAWYLDGYLRRFSFYVLFSPGKFITLILALIVSLNVVLLFIHLPVKYSDYLHSPFDAKNNPLIANETYRKIINNAWRDNIPLVGIDTLAGENSLMAASWFFLDTSNYTNGKAPAFVPVVTAEGNRCFVLSRKPFVNQENVIDAIRAPFRLKSITRFEIGKLAEEKFPD
jgi:hypothetical protein